LDSQGSVTTLIEQLRSDDSAIRDDAARRIWDRYVPALLDLARSHLDCRLLHRADEEDVLQSMYASFCLRQRRGSFSLSGRDDLCRQIALLKLEGYTNKEIARELDDCTERTIERKLRRIRARWLRFDDVIE